MSWVIVLFSEPREVYIDDQGQGSNVAASGRPRVFPVNAGKHTFRLGADIRRDRYSQQGNQFPRSSPSFQNQAAKN